MLSPHRPNAPRPAGAVGARHRHRDFSPDLSAAHLQKENLFGPIRRGHARTSRPLIVPRLVGAGVGTVSAGADRLPGFPGPFPPPLWIRGLYSVWHDAIRGESLCQRRRPVLPLPAARPAVPIALPPRPQPAPAQPNCSARRARRRRRCPLAPGGSPSPAPSGAEAARPLRQMAVAGDVEGNEGSAHWLGRWRATRRRSARSATRRGRRM